MLLLQAFLSRAVQQLSASCQQQGLPESAVARKLRTRGIDLAQLQDRAAEVQRGVAECASDEGWNLIQVSVNADNIQGTCCCTVTVAVCLSSSTWCVADSVDSTRPPLVRVQQA
jgi:hypothetical protein